MPVVVVGLLVIFFALLMRQSYKSAVKRWEIECDEMGINVRRRPQSAAVAADPLAGLCLLYPHGVIRPAIDDVTGASVLEVDVKDWDHVRVMELECLGAHYHRADGSTKACGWEPVGEDTPAEAQPSRVIRPAAESYYASRTGYNERPCFCAYCHGRVGEHGEDARALYKAQSAAALDKVQVMEARRRAEIIAEGLADEDAMTPESIHAMTMRDYAKMRDSAMARAHKCAVCGSFNVWQSTQDDLWLCHSSECLAQVEAARVQRSLGSTTGGFIAALFGDMAAAGIIEE